jgi:hypothetical protein
MKLRYSANVRGSDLKVVGTFSSKGVIVPFMKVQTEGGFGLPLGKGCVRIVAVNPLQTKIYPTTIESTSVICVNREGVLKVAKAVFARTHGCWP